MSKLTEELEATIETLESDNAHLNALLKEKNAKYKQLEEQLGCPLDVYAKIQSGLVDIIYVKRYETVRNYWDENGLQLEQKECLVPRSITRVERRYFYYQDILGKEDMYFSKYGTEFWLKEDKSE